MGDKLIRTEVQEVLNASTTWGHTDVEGDWELLLYLTELPWIMILFNFFTSSMTKFLNFGISNQDSQLYCLFPWRAVGDKNGTVTLKQEYSLPNPPSFENCENVRFYISFYHYTYFTNCTEEVHYMQQVHSFCLPIALSRVIKTLIFLITSCEVFSIM